MADDICEDDRDSENTLRAKGENIDKKKGYNCQPRRGARGAYMYKGMDSNNAMMIPAHVGSVHHPLQRFLDSQPKLYARDSLDMIGVCS